MLSAQEKITTAVSEYKRLFKSEYDLFLKSNHITIGKQKNKWASTGTDTALERHLYDTPEKLHHAINRLLTDEELSWWNGRDDYKGSLQAAQWFVRTFPEFKVTKDF